MVFGLYVLTLRAEISSDELVRDIGEAIVENHGEDFPPEKRAVLSERLKLLLTFDSSFKVTAKLST